MVCPRARTRRRGIPPEKRLVIPHEPDNHSTNQLIEPMIDTHFEEDELQGAVEAHGCARPPETGKKMKKTPGKRNNSRLKRRKHPQSSGAASGQSEDRWEAESDQLLTPDGGSC